MGERVISESWGADQLTRGLEVLRQAVVDLLIAEPALVPATPAPRGESALSGFALSDSVLHSVAAHTGPGNDGAKSYGDSAMAASSEENEADRERLIALVELARGGDKDAFGALFDHYHPAVYRFLFYRTRSQTLAEDLAPRPSSAPCAR